jgi:hypothetical protein
VRQNFVKSSPNAATLRTLRLKSQAKSRINGCLWRNVLRGRHRTRQQKVHGIAPTGEFE